MRAIVVCAVLCASACATTQSKPAAATPRHHRAHQRVAQAPASEEGAPGEEATGSAPNGETMPIAPPAEIAEPPEEGLASYYADSLAGNRTASGERYRPDDKTCAHRTHKFGTKLVVTNMDNGKSAVCRVNDRGPYVQGRVVDLSKRMATELGMLKRGVAKVRVERAAEGAGS